MKVRTLIYFPNWEAFCPSHLANFLPPMFGTQSRLFPNQNFSPSFDSHVWPIFMSRRFVPTSYCLMKASTPMSQLTLGKVSLMEVIQPVISSS